MKQKLKILFFLLGVVALAFLILLIAQAAKSNGSKNAILYSYTPKQVAQINKALNIQLNNFYEPNSTEISGLTDYLNTVNAVLYYRPNCEFCIWQEQFFNIEGLKNKIDIINYTASNSSVMVFRSDIPSYVTGTPTWVTSNGTVYNGAMNYYQLSKFYGYLQ